MSQTLTYVVAGIEDDAAGIGDDAAGPSKPSLSVNTSSPVRASDVACEFVTGTRRGNAESTCLVGGEETTASKIAISSSLWD